MDPTFQLIGFMLAIGVPSLTSLVGLLINNSRMSDLRADIAEMQRHIDARFAAQEALFNANLRRVEEVMDARLTRIEDILKIR